MPQTPDLVGTTEASRILKVNPATITRWAADGTLTVVTRLPSRNGALFFERAQVKRLRDARAEVAA